MDTLKTLGVHEQDVRRQLEVIQREQWVARIWSKDASLWKSDPAVHPSIVGMLGWLQAVDSMRPHVPRLEAFRDKALADGVRHVVLLGMGGSSLCPEVLRATFGSQPGHPALTVLDSVDPSMVRRVEREAPCERTLFLVSSKSGTTTESDSLMRFFIQRLQERVGDSWARHVAAITDPDTALARFGADSGFREVFLNPPDIGGRFSALSLFGLVPAALLGVNLSQWLDAAADMVERCRGEEASSNPGAALGAVMGALAAQGRDKLVILLPQTLQTLGLWIEQLIAESVGKEGVGILPLVVGVDGSDVGARLPADGSGGQCCVQVTVGEPGVEEARASEELARRGYPVYRVALNRTEDLAGEFFRWEFATAVAGACLQVNPFDQPNVQEAKDRTNALLKRQRESGNPEDGWTVQWSENGCRAMFAPSVWAHLGRAADMWESWWSFTNPGGYLALLAYMPYEARYAQRLEALARRLTRELGITVTWAFGPRYLHSTGQLHKGGPANGMFVILLADDEEPVDIPGREFSFQELKRAQAMGDMAALTDRTRPVAFVRLQPPVEASLAHIIDVLTASIPSKVPPTRPG